jgi:GT2 family glycosyltransferase
MKKIFVVSVDYNSHEETHNCLASLKTLDTPNIDLHIVVVDNASKTPLELKTAEKKEKTVLLRNEINLGFSGGNNIGIQYAMSHGADYVLLINNDTYADKNILVELRKVLDEDRLAGLVSPKIYFAKGYEYHKERYKKDELGKVLWYAGGFIDWNNVVPVHRGVDEVDNGQYDTKEEVTFASGCCMLIKREVLEKIKGFDDRYFLYFEDADLNQRVRQLGYKTFYNPKAIIWHVSAASSGIGSALHDYFLTRNRLLFGFTYATLRTKFALLRESLRLLIFGREWQKTGIRDYCLGKFGKGSYK